MRFTVISAALLALTTSALATSNGFISPNGGDKLKCRRINRVEWKKFEFEKKLVWLVVTDKLNKVITSQQVEPAKGSADIFIPEFFQRTAKLAIVDDKNTALFESGEEISIDCDKKKRERDGQRKDGNTMDGERDWNSDEAMEEAL